MPLWEALPQKPERGMNPADPIAAFNTAVNNSGINAIGTNIQTFVAAMVRQEYARNWQEYRSSGGTLNFRQYYQHGVQGNGFSGALGRPMDFSIFAGQKVTYDGQPTTVGALAPGLAGIRSVRDANRWLFGTMSGALAEHVKYDPNAPEKYNAMAGAVMDRVWQFTPFAKKNTHGLVSRSFVNDASWAAKSGLRDLRRSEEKTIGDGNFIDAMNGDAFASMDEFTSAPVASGIDLMPILQNNAYHNRSIYGNYGVSDEIAQFIGADDVVNIVAPGSLAWDAGIRAGDAIPGLAEVLSGRAIHDPNALPGTPGYLYDLADEIEAGTPTSLSFLHLQGNPADLNYELASGVGSAVYNPTRPDHEVTGPAPYVNPNANAPTRRYPRTFWGRSRSRTPINQHTSEEYFESTPLFGSDVSHSKTYVKGEDVRYWNKYTEHEELFADAHKQSDPLKLEKKEERIKAWKTFDPMLQKIIEERRSAARRFANTKAKHQNLMDNDALIGTGLHRPLKEDINAENNVIFTDAQDYKDVPADEITPFPRIEDRGNELQSRALQSVMRHKRNLRTSDIPAPEAAVNKKIFGMTREFESGVSANSVPGKRMSLERKMNTLFRDPAQRANARYVGSNDPDEIKAWQGEVRMLNEHTGVDMPTDPSAFGEAYGQLLSDNPEAASQYATIIPTEAELLDRFNKKGAARRKMVSGTAFSEPEVAARRQGRTRAEIPSGEWRATGVKPLPERDWSVPEHKPMLREVEPAQSSPLLLAAKSQSTLAEEADRQSRILWALDTRKNPSAPSAPIPVGSGGGTSGAGNVSPASGGGSGRPPVNNPPPVDYDDMDDNDWQFARDYDNKTLRSEGSTPVPPTSNPRPEGYDDYEIDPTNPLNSLLRYNHGFERWKAAYADMYPESELTRERYEASVKNGMIEVSRANTDAEARQIVRRNFGYLTRDKQAQIVSAQKRNLPPAEQQVEEARIRQAEVASGYRRGDESGAVDPVMSRRQIFEQSSDHEVSREIHRRAVERERAEYMANNGGEARFAKNAEIQNIREAINRPDLRVRTDRTSFTLTQLREGRDIPAGMTQGDTTRAVNEARVNFEGAVEASLPNGGEDVVASIDKRVYKRIQQSANKYMAELEQSGVSHDVAEAKSKLYKEIQQGVYKAAMGVAGGISEDLRFSAPGGNRASIGSITRRTAAGISELFKIPEIAEKFAEAGITQEDLLSRNEANSVTVSANIGGIDTSFTAYGVDDKGNPYTSELGAKYQKQGRGMWGGPAGQFLYGAYIAKRMWNFAAEGEFQASSAYGKYISSIGYLSGYGGDASGLISTEAGYTSRQTIGQLYKGEGANQQFGFFQDIPYYMSHLDKSGTLSRLGSAAGVGLGVGMAGSMVPGMFGMAGTAAGTALGTAGWAIGGAVIAGAGIAEAANAIGHSNGNLPSYENYTLGTIAKDGFITQPIYSNAIEKYNLEVSKLIHSEGITGVEAGKQLGKPDSLSRYDSLSKWSTMEFTEEQRDFLAQYMTPEDRMLSGATVTDAQRKKLAKIKKLGKAVMEAGGGDDSVAAVNAMYKLFGENISDEAIEKFTNASATTGRTASGMLSEASSYASSYGLLPGTEAYYQKAQQYADIKNEGGRTLAQFEASRISQLGSQMQSVMGSSQGYYGLGNQIIDNYGYQTQAQVGGFTSAVTSMQQYGAVLNPSQLQMIGYNAAQIGPLRSQVFGDIAGTIGFMGGTTNQQQQMFSILSGAGLSNQQTYNLGQALGGDAVGALSYMSWQNGTTANRWLDRSGNNIWETNGIAALDVVRGHPELSVANPPSARYGSNGQLDLTASILGTDNQGLIDAFNKGGTRGMQQYQSDLNYKNQLASIGVQVQGVHLAQQHYWGSGTYDNPGAGSMWALEDQQRMMSYNSTMLDFAAQGKRMNLQNQYSIAQENISLERMNASNDYNNWSQTANYNYSLMQRGWTQEDWQYQDQTRALNWGWQMEDMDESIRYSSGRQRRIAVRNKERATISHNLEEEQIDKTRERQEKSWALEDERYQKTREYTLELQGLDKESYELNKKHREEMFALDKQEYARKIKEFKESYALQTQMTELSRKYQKEQLDLQLQAAGVASKAATDQKAYEDSTRNISNYFGDIKGNFEAMSKYDQAYSTIQALTTLFGTADKIDDGTLLNLTGLMNAIAKVTYSPALQTLLQILQFGDD